MLLRRKKARELLLSKLVSNKSHAEKIQLGNGSGLEFQFQPRILYGSQRNRMLSFSLFLSHYHTLYYSLSSTFFLFHTLSAFLLPSLSYILYLKETVNGRVKDLGFETGMVASCCEADLVWMNEGTCVVWLLQIMRKGERLKAPVLFYHSATTPGHQNAGKTKP